MLQIKNISKKYTTGDLVQTALDDVSLNLRDNEFVAILGPSGSGKTTLLNVIGGLDRYDSGDLIINSISTKKYKDKDWDSYRNHTIGFVFQSYNLIPHQTILANVELALTISGISRSERKTRAKKALEEVGLGDQLHKKPNQMSGGQMQRVAIARALVNNPDILLADEPTGALDSETSVQVMELLKEVAKNRLVVMVTHNPELAEEYATRIVRLKDGNIIDDSDPFTPDESKLSEPEHKNMGKSSMSFFTSLALSFNNLKTKKGRTFLTAFAGSIGIIGIALILSLSNGVNNYIEDIQRQTMTSYPIQIAAQSFDMSAMMQAGHEKALEEVDHELDGVYVNGTDIEMFSNMTNSIKENNLTDFKKYLDDKDSEIHKYIGENGVVYSYDSEFSVFRHDPDNILVNTDGSTINSSVGMGSGTMSGMSFGNYNISEMMGLDSNNFAELMPGTNGKLISKVITDNYQVAYGNWPEKYNEITLLLDDVHEISAIDLYELGLLPANEYKEILYKIGKGEKVEIESKKWTYEEIANMSFYLIPACDMFVKGENGLYTSVAGDSMAIEGLLKNAVELKISAIIKPKKDADYLSLVEPLGYTRLLTEYLIDYTQNSEVVKAQLASPDVNILSGVEFAPADDKAKAENAKTYLSNLGVSDKAKMFKNMMMAMAASDPDSMAQFETMSETELAAMMDEFLKNPQDEALIAIYDAYISTGSLDDNLEAFGVISIDTPSGINIYADSFEDKDKISECIADYNKTVSEENKINYTDYVALLMSSVTTIVDVISYVLIAFVSVSLIVSSIMIGIITYISVLERTKEIGILRAIGASKKNISQVFNAETFIIGLCSGLLGVGVTLLLLIPGNAIIHALTGTKTVNAALPVAGGIILVILSMILTLIGGLIPSKKAARKDPVTALRTE